MADVTSSAAPEYAKAVNKSVGAAIRERRDALGMTQGALAAQVGISRASIANIERGEQTVGVPLLMRLSAALTTPPAELLREPSLDDVSSLLLSDSERTLLAGVDDDRAKLWVAAFLPSETERS